MGKDLQIFKNQDFGQVRVLERNGEPWFIGKEVANILGYRNGSRDINRHVDEEDKTEITIYDGRQNRNMIAINESGLYSLILGSELPSAKQFKRWITHEVIPAIRKHGAYMTPKKMDEYKKLEIEARYKNAKAREGRLLLSIVKDYGKLISPESKQLILSNITELVTGQALIPKPVINRTYTAGDIAEEAGISANMIGRIANKHDLKTDEYGMTILDKSRYSNKQVTSFVYNEEGRKKLLEIINREEA